jgi:hypothetical protein
MNDFGGVCNVEPNADESVTSFDYMTSDHRYEKNQAIDWQLYYIAAQNQEQNTKAHHR